MCDIGTAALISQGVGAVGSAIGGAMQASSRKKSLQFDAFIARKNAEARRDDARFAIQRGTDAESQLRTAAGMLKGKQRAAMGANNVDMTTGSALNRLVSTDVMKEQDANRVRLNAVREAIGYRRQATSETMRATMRQGEAEGISPFLTGASSLLTSANRVATNWYIMRNASQGGGGATDGATLAAILGG